MAKLIQELRLSNGPPPSTGAGVVDADSPTKVSDVSSGMATLAAQEQMDQAHKKGFAKNFAVLKECIKESRFPSWKERFEGVYELMNIPDPSMPEQTLSPKLKIFLSKAKAAVETFTDLTSGGEAETPVLSQDATMPTKLDHRFAGVSTEAPPVASSAVAVAAPTAPSIDTSAQKKVTELVNRLEPTI
ncbi:MAG: hypothetical protein SGARI_000462 [Bacillariaceae sp.]